VALGAGPGDCQEALVEAHLAAAAAGVARAGRLVALGAGAVARLAALQAGDGEGLLDPEGGLLEGDLQVVPQVVSERKARPHKAPPHRKVPQPMTGGTYREFYGPCLSVQV
jgi:hypothetical protein